MYESEVAQTVDLGHKHLILDLDCTIFRGNSQQVRNSQTSWVGR